MRRLIPWITAGVVASGLPARSETPGPSPPPPRLLQDDLDLQARSNVVQGSGARAFGMGGAFLARADDATAASWNPAGLSYLRRPELSLVWAAANDLEAVVRGLDGSLRTNDRRSGSAADFAAATYPFAAGSVTGAAQLSFQRVIPFGGHRTIDTAEAASTVDSTGGFDVIALGSGLQVSRKVRLGATINRWFNGYRQTRQRQFLQEAPDRPLRQKSSLQTQDWGLSGWNVHLGVIVSPWESLNLGAVAKTSFSAPVDLKRSRLDTYSFPPEPDLTTSNEYESHDAALDFPGAWGVGASWRPRSVLTLSVDYTRTHWSAGRILGFFTLPRTLPDEPPPKPEPPTDVFPVLPYPQLYDPTGLGQTDTQQTRLGVEYVVIWKRLKVPLRAGFFTDTQYFRGASGRPPRYKGWTAGTGLLVGSILLDAAYVHESGHYNGLEADGTEVREVRNSLKADRVYLSLIYRYTR